MLGDVLDRFSAHFVLQQNPGGYPFIERTVSSDFQPPLMSSV